jgi:RNA polymerase sigma-70 factor (sigma-E family)
VDFEEYVGTRGRSLLRLAYLLTGDQHQAEDLVQTALLRAFRRWARVCRSDHPDAYVRRTMLNAYLSWGRRRSSSELPVDLAGSDRAAAGSAVADHAEAVASQDAAWRLLAQLPPRARAVMVLRYYADYDDTAIAAVLGITASSVRATASRALATLGDRLGASEQEKQTDGSRRER